MMSNPRYIKKWVTWFEGVNAKLLKRAHHHLGSKHKTECFIFIVDVEQTNGFIMVKVHKYTAVSPYPLIQYPKFTAARKNLKIK
jgi:hypothetical protein